MATQRAVPTKEALEDQARRLLEKTRGQTGASVEEMVKALGDLQPRGAGTRRSWYDWNERPETISLLTGLAAIHMLGPEAAMDLLFGDASTADAGSSTSDASSRLDELHRAVADAVADTAGLRQHVEAFVVPELAKQGELIGRMLSDMQRAGLTSEPSTKAQPTKQRRRSARG